MLERFARGWAIAKGGWAVLKMHPKLLVLPVLGTIALLSVIAAIVAPGVILMIASEHAPRPLDGGPGSYALFFAFYFACTSVAVFFNAAQVFCSLEALSGRAPSLRAGLAAAARRLPQILA